MNGPSLALALLLTPLASATLIALFLRRKHGIAAALSVAAAAAIAVFAGLLIFATEGTVRASQEWLTIGSFQLSLGFLVDDLAKLMLFVVAFVGFLIHLFSVGYMADDGAKARFFGGLSVFMFSMLGIVLADSLIMIFIFWELVGFSSYLLINHYCTKQSAADASKKAFIVNRVGDFGFLLGIAWCYAQFGTTNLDQLAALAGKADVLISAGLPLLLFCGAAGKSAQMPLHVWLPDAMEGPTPVSALIHAATMVAAGIYMLCRIHFLMVPEALQVIAWIGTITAVYAALCAIVQRDIKKVLAYSTLSQLGYMVAAFGLGSLVAHGAHDGHGHDHGAHAAVTGALTAGAAAAMFHLVTHAFFKALMFLGSASVIHGCHHEQDIFKMGGLRKKMPVTFLTFTVGVAAIVGVPMLAGFFSKDAILYLAFENNKAIFAVLTFTAVLTSFYMIRMWKITFFGEPRSEDASHAHESGITMLIPLLVLAVLSIVGGYTGFFSQIAGSLAGLRPHAEGSMHWILFGLTVAILLVGGGAALVLYPAKSTDALQERSPGAFGMLTATKESFDKVYGYYVAKVQQRFAMVLNFIDTIFVAGFARLLGGVAGAFGLGARALHVGSIHGYVYWFLIGTVLFWGIATGIF